MRPPPRPRRLAGALVLGGVALLTALCTAACTAATAQSAPPTSPTASLATPPAVRYVALGDSYTSGPLIVPQTDPTTCLRSGNNYAGITARALRVASFTDVSCSGATTTDFTTAQPGTVSGTNPPQYTALKPNTTLVTVGIGGNDIGLVQLAEGCINLAPPPNGTSCAAQDTRGGHDVYGAKIEKFAPTYGRVIAAIRARSPHARIVLVGYPTAIRFGGCYPEQPVYGRDATYIQSKIDQLDSVMAAQAKAHGATYVNLLPSTRGHDACALPGKRWIEGVIPSSDAYPLHPNVLSMRNTAKVLQAALK